ncbi:MAG TPA: amidase family protein [Mycobacterium sp.]|nr:amidase family protein [Mycobacterium sp.]
MSDALWRWNAVEIVGAVKLGRLSCREVVTACLDRLAEVNDAVNAVTVMLADDALCAAAEADRRVAHGDTLGPLHGVPVTIKENVDLAGSATTNGVVAFQDVVANSDSPVVANLKRAGAIVIGRTNTPAFGLRFHTDNALRGPTLNPWNKARTPGGSSGGAAASLAVGITPIAHGNDYGGSIRYPAHCCGITGIRPSLGRVPAFNATHLDERSLTGQTFSVQGPMARRVGDVRLALGAMARRDMRDPWWVPAPLVGPQPTRPIRVALTTDPGREGVNPFVAEAVRRAGHALERAGYAVEEVDPPDVDAISRLWSRLVWTEIRHTVEPVARKYGDPDFLRVLDMVLASAPPLDLDGYINDWARRAGYVRDWFLFLERYPLVVGPVSAEPALAVGFDTDASVDGERLRLIQRMLLAVNVLGLPAVAVPAGIVDGLPLGVQVIGSRYREDLCLDAAEAIEAQCKLDTPIDPRW